MSKGLSVVETNINVPAELGLLDVAVVIVENWLLLLVSPIVAGLVALVFFSFWTPQTFDSVALLRINATEAAMLPSARTLNPAIVGTAYLNEDRSSNSRAVQHLTEDLLSVTQEGEIEMYRVRVRYKSAAGAQELLTRIINSLIANSTPTPSEAALLAIRIEQTKRSIDELELNLARTNRLAASMEDSAVLSVVTIGELGEALVAFVASIEERHTRLFQLEQALKGSVSSEDILQPATLPDSPNARSVAISSAFVGVAVAFAAIVFSFVAAGWKGASQSVDGRQKINRIRRTFGLQPKG